MAAASISPRRSVRALRRRGRPAIRRVGGRLVRRAMARTRAGYRWALLDRPLRRYLSTSFDGSGPVLVIGPPTALRRARPHEEVDVVGTDPLDAGVTVVSAAEDEGSLPRRWNRVVVTDVDVADTRIQAAVDACLPGGTVVVLTRRCELPPLGDRVVEVQASRSRGLTFHRLRVTG